MDVFTRLTDDDPFLLELDERQFAVEDFITKLAWALCTNTHLRRIVFRASNAAERVRRNRLLVVALMQNPQRPLDSSWIEEGDGDNTNLFCQLRICAENNLFT